MKQLKIWEKYLLGEIGKIFLFFLFALYALYILIDYSVHLKIFQKYMISWDEVSLYYLAHFFRRLQIMLPFALTLATSSVLCRLNMRNELLALLAGGVSRWQIMRPFLYFSFLCLVLVYSNFQYLEPHMLPHIDRFESQYFQGKKEEEILSQNVHWIALADRSKIIYQNYDAAKKCFCDVFWVRSVDDLYYMKYLLPTIHSSPIGYYVDHFQRNRSSGNLEQTQSFEKIELPFLHLEEQTVHRETVPLENYSLTELWNMVHQSDRFARDKKGYEEQAMLYFKLFLPLLCLWSVIMPASWCFQFDRKFSSFRIYSQSLFWLVFFFTSINAAVILGENGVFNPLLAIGCTFVLFFVPFIIRFVRQLFH